MPRLYELASEIAAICDGEELSPDLESRLDALEMDLSAKVDGCCRLLREMQHEGNKFASEARRLADIADTLQRKHDRLKEYVKTCLTLAGLKKLDTELFKLTIAKNGQPSVTCDGPPPEGFQRITVELDRSAILAAWKEEKPLPPGVNVVQGCHLRVK